MTSGRRTELVSVYLPTRNRAAELERAAQSVLAQDHEELELLIVDDGSSDDTPQVLARLAREDERVRVLRLPAARGASAARNVALGEARGAYVTGLDDDDLMLSGRLSSLLAAHDDRYAFVCSPVYVADERGGWYSVKNAGPSVIDLEYLLVANLVGNQALVRTDRVRSVGGFDETWPAWQDYDLWTRLVLRYGPALRVAEPTYVFFTSQDTGKITNSPAVVEGARLYRERFGPLMNESQRKGQRLLEYVMERRRLTLADVRECWCPATRRALAGYWFRSNLPALTMLTDAYRRRRWPLKRLLSRAASRAPARS